MEYSITVWRTPVRESKQVLYHLTFRREWVQELNCWRDTLVSQQIDSATDRISPGTTKGQVSLESH